MNLKIVENQILKKFGVPKGIKSSFFRQNLSGINYVIGCFPLESQRLVKEYILVKNEMIIENG